MAQPKQIREILIKVDTRGNKELLALKKEFSNLNKSMAETSGVLKKFDGIFSAFFGASVLGIGVTQLTAWADTMQKLTDRMQLFAAPGENALKIMDDIAKSSDITRTSIEDTATVFTRVRVATEELGLSTDQTLKFTQALQQSFRISGATAEEAAASTIQLTQALSNGRLQGQELRSVTLQNAIAGKLLAESLNTTRGGLKKLGEEGKITTDVVLKAFLENAEKLDEQAKGIGATFGEGVTKALNKFKVALNEINDDLDISGKFNKGIDLAIENSKLLVAVLTGLAVTTIPSLILGIKALFTSLSVAIGLTPGINAIALALGAITSAGTYIYLNFDKIKESLSELSLMFKVRFNDMAVEALGLGKTILNAFNPFGLLDGFINGKLDALTESFKKKSEAAKFELEAYRALKASAGGADEAFFREGNKAPEAKLPKTDVKKTVEEQIAALNAKYNRGKVSVERYNEAITKLQKSLLDKKAFQEGSITLSKYNKELRELGVENKARLFEKGKISAEEFNEAVKQNKIADLNEDLKAMKITTAEYNKEMLELSDTFSPTSALSVGLDNYIKSAGTLAQNIAGVVSQTFTNLENELFDFVKKGTFEFSKLTQAILDDLTRIAIRQAIVLPIAQGLGSLIGPPTTATTTQAHGGAWANGVQFFAKGGIVDSPTMFGMSGGYGVMGERGAEAILPLQRTASGDLGVKASAASSNVVVNIINQSGNEVEQKETTNPDGSRQLDILVTARVKDAFSNGAMDRTMSSLYGLRRKGV